MISRAWNELHVSFPFARDWRWLIGWSSGNEQTNKGHLGYRMRGIEILSNFVGRSTPNVSQFTDFGDVLGNITVERRGSINETYEER